MALFWCHHYPSMNVSLNETKSKSKHNTIHLKYLTFAREFLMQIFMLIHIMMEVKNNSDIFNELIRFNF